MKTKKLTKLAMLLFAAVMCVSAAACGGDEGGEKEIELLVDLHSLRPTISSEPTFEEPDVIVAAKLIAESFYAETGIKIRWDRTKDVAGGTDYASEYFINKIETGTCPVIAFTWGTQFQERDYYVDLAPYLAQPNEFVEGNEKWSDLYEDYLFSENNIMDAKGQIVALPVQLVTGMYAGYYYNADLLGDSSLPKNWFEFTSLVDDLRGTPGVKHPFVNWPMFKKISLEQWFFKENLGPSMASMIFDQTDYDSDGYVTTAEQLRAVKAGLYNPQQHDYAKELYRLAKSYYSSNILPGGWQSVDYANDWYEGSVAFLEDGTWSIYNEYSYPGREWDWGIMPFPPLVKRDGYNYGIDNLEFTESGPYRPGCNVMFNIMKPAVRNKPELLDAAVKFLKFLSKPENVTMMVEENGTGLGAVKGSVYSGALDEILDQPFPMMPKCTWPLGFTTSATDKIDRSFAEWLLGDRSESSFFSEVNTYMQQGADEYISRLGLDTAGW